jgi:two-component system phosphate regulon sensor histidine kinase PhoR
MESSAQSELNSQDSITHAAALEQMDHVNAIRREMAYLNKIGKRFVAANDRFEVHHALIAALQEIYNFSACSILLKGEPFELSIIPRYPPSAPFLQSIITRITRAANVIGFPEVTAEEMAVTAYLDAPDEFALENVPASTHSNEVKDFLNIPLTVEDRIIGMLSLFDEKEGTFDTELLQLTTMIADYAAIALENARLRERENILWKAAEMERRRLELIISSMSEGLLITNTQGAITFSNPSARQIFSQAQVVFKADYPLKLLAEEQNASWLNELAQLVEQALAGKTMLRKELIAGVKGEAVPLTLSISAAPLDDPGQKPAAPIGVVAVLNDITSSKQIERLKDEFVSVASHELRTPLTAIKGYTQHLIRRIERRMRENSKESGLPTNETHESYNLRNLSIIQSQTEHLERLVNDLLDHSRVQWGQLQLNFSTFRLADVLRERIPLAQNTADLHTISLDMQVEASEITADRNRVSQVIGNILDNAIKFSPQGGNVMVRLQQQDDNYVISVVDEGIGISPEYFGHIFERFYRVRNTASSQYSGIGLGLFVAKAIVEGHHGKIWLSRNQGSGSTFFFTLPRTQQTQHNQTA